MHLSPQQRAALLDEAREVIRRRLSGGDGAGGSSAAAPDAAASPEPALSQHAGCFVSLHELRSHRLRGCVGRLEASAPLWDTVRAVAGNVLQDPRFADRR